MSSFDKLKRTKYLTFIRKFTSLILDNNYKEAHDLIPIILYCFPNIGRIEKAKLYADTCDYNKAIEILEINDYRSLNMEELFLLLTYYNIIGNRSKTLEIARYYLEITRNASDINKVIKVLDNLYCKNIKVSINPFKENSIKVGSVVRFHHSRKYAAVSMGLIWKIEKGFVYFFPLSSEHFSKYYTCLSPSDIDSLNDCYDVLPHSNKLPINLVKEIYYVFSEDDEKYLEIKRNVLSCLSSTSNLSDLDKEFMKEYKSSLNIQIGDILYVRNGEEILYYLVINDSNCILIELDDNNKFISRCKIVKLSELQPFDSLHIDSNLQEKLINYYNGSIGNYNLLFGMINQDINNISFYYVNNSVVDLYNKDKVIYTFYYGTFDDFIDFVIEKLRDIDDNSPLGINWSKLFIKINEIKQKRKRKQKSNK